MVKRNHKLALYREVGEKEAESNSCNSKRDTRWPIKEEIQTSAGVPWSIVRRFLLMGVNSAGISVRRNLETPTSSTTNSKKQPLRQNQHGADDKKQPIITNLWL